ncbi:MAG TPA: thiolase domain-containing protein, partial [Streptosporangiaceae bacterium]|nr:thiolase domain-containing protein [Streptosporangiaceae bacterium]
MGSANAWIAGSYQSDFARNYAREGLEISDMVAEAVAGTLENARIGPEDVESIHVGNAFGQLFTGQGQLGAMPATVEPRLWGKPAARHEAACASGSVATLAATAEIEAGRYDCILVLAVEQERNVPGKDAPKHLGTAAWIGHEGQDATFMWPYMFSQLADEYERRYGLDNQHLHAIAELNMRNARANPLAQTRTWSFGTAGLPLQPKLDRSRDERYVFPHVRRVVTDAFRRAEVADVRGLDGIETHDCFSMSEYMAIDHFGITEPGESWKAIENGELERD